MPFNVPNNDNWVEFVRALSTVDQLEGGPGGVMNFPVDDLTRRTNWLKGRVDELSSRIYEDIAAARTVLAADLRKHFAFRQAGDNRIAFSPTASRNSIGGGEDRYTISFYPPTEPGTTGISLQYRMVGNTTWIPTEPVVSPLRVPIQLIVPENLSLEFRLVSRGGNSEGQTTAIFTTATSGVSPLTTATLPALSSVPNGQGFYFCNEEILTHRVGRILTAGSDVIRVEQEELTQLFVKPGRDGFWLVRSGSVWRLVDGESPRRDVGLIVPHAIGVPVRGWLPCDGQLVSRTVYADLFARIGTQYGIGDGSTSFQLPDLRGEFIRGWSNGRTNEAGVAVDANRQFGSFQPQFTEDMYVRFDPNVAQDYFMRRVSTPSWIANWQSFDSQGDTANSISSVRSEGLELGKQNNATETRPRNLAFQYLIKY